MHQDATPYIPKNKIRIITAASLFDGHDAAINIMRRIIQSTGAEVLHNYGIDRIFSPDDGRTMGLQGMINDLLSKCDFPTGKNVQWNEN